MPYIFFEWLVLIIVVGVFLLFDKTRIRKIEKNNRGIVNESKEHIDEYRKEESIRSEKILSVLIEIRDLLKKS